MDFIVRVKNQGIGSSGTALAKYYVNENPGQDINIPSLWEGEIVNVAFSLTPDQVKVGSMQVKVVVDSGNAVSESNEANNELTIIIYTPGPKLFPVADFSVSPMSGYTPLPVQFSDLSQNAASWSWNFGDGWRSTKRNPIHTYSVAGNYVVTQTISNTNGTDSKAVLITVLKPVRPVAGFYSNVISGSAPLNVAFTDTSTGTPTSWKWSFGDGAYSTAKDPVHKYSKAKKYTVSLTVKNAKGSNTKLGYITVTAPPVKPIASFTANKVSGKHPLTVTFTYTGTGGAPDSYLWKISDGTTSTQAKTATYTFTKAGEYTVGVTVTNRAGISTATKTGYIKVS